MPNDNELLILAIESATRAGSVCVARGHRVLASVSGSASSSHSADLIENIDSALRGASLELSDIDLFAAASGPGSFTGLRIGLATIKSLAVCMRRNCVGISTLAAIAHAGGKSSRTVALLPAGRGEVFAQMFSVDDDGAQALDGPAHLSPSALAEKYVNLPELTWAGEATLLGQTLPAGAGNWSVTMPERLAASIAALARREFRGGNTVGPEKLQATYVRASDAEISQRLEPRT